jgi:hypothetical protein
MAVYPGAVYPGQFIPDNLSRDSLSPKDSEGKVVNCLYLYIFQQWVNFYAKIWYFDGEFMHNDVESRFKNF